MYEARDGSIVGPLSQVPDTDEWVCEVDGEVFTWDAFGRCLDYQENGEYVRYVLGKCSLDLIDAARMSKETLLDLWAVNRFNSLVKSGKVQYLDFDTLQYKNFTYSYNKRYKYKPKSR